MPSDAQIAANRSNAQKSTGPRSAEGKAISSRNALTSGVHAQSAIIRGEDPASLDALTTEYYATHTPFTAEERFHVDSMIRFDWQLRRLTRVEAELYEYRALESSRLSPTCPMGQIYSNNSATFSRLTRQVATIQRCFRESASEFKTLRAARIDLGETNPISTSGVESGAGASACQPACTQPAETNPIPVPEPVISTTSDPSGADPLVCGRTPVRPLSDPEPPAETNPIPVHLTAREHLRHFLQAIDAPRRADQ